MANDDTRRSDGAPRKKKKKKRKPVGQRSVEAAAVVPALPPPPTSNPFATVLGIGIACALAGAFFYHYVVRGNGSSTSPSADSSAAANTDSTATPPDVAAPPADAKKTASGLAYRVLRAGNNTSHPVPSDRVRVHYAGWSQDGKLFDSSYTRGEPATFGVTQVIKGWTEGLQLMSVGEKTRFWIPAELAYGEHAAGGRPSGQLTFDVELLEIVK